MLVGFLGAPNSGKTTIAAQVFAELKKTGQPNVEFIVEEARRHIAEIKFTGDRPLTEQDQYEIFVGQSQSEYMMHNACKDGIVISDSSALNSLWYMKNPDYFQSTTIYRDYCEFLKENGILFYCPIIGIPHTSDNLRIHTRDQTKEIDVRCCTYMAFEKKWLPVAAQLTGPIDFRVNKAIEKIYGRITG